MIEPIDYPAQNYLVLCTEPECENALCEPITVLAPIEAPHIVCGVCDSEMITQEEESR